MKSLQARLEAVFVKMLDDLIKKIPDIIVSLMLLVIFVLAALLIRHVVQGSLRRMRVERNVQTLVSRLVYYLVLAIGLVQVLSQLSVNLAALGIGVGMFGFAVGFALKDILSNFLSGILILWTHHFSAGDQIRIRDYEGTVEAIEIRGTILRTYDGRQVTIPNSDVYTNAVINNTYHRNRRSSIFASVAYDTDFANAEKVIRAALAGVPDVAVDPSPDVLVSELGGYAIRLEIRIWTPAPQIEMLTVNSEAAKAIKQAFDAAGIELPYPTQTILLRESEPADDSPPREQ